MIKKSSFARTKWSASQLQGYIREESANTINVIFLPHALKRMRERKINMVCALETLRKGRINLPPEIDSNTGDIKCRMEYFVAGADVKIVVAIGDDNPNLIIVTVI